MNKHSKIIGVFAITLTLLGLTTITVNAKEHHTVKHEKIGKKSSKTKLTHIPSDLKIVGIASYYGYESGPRTANGEKFNPKLLTAAHRTLPFNTKVKVTNLENNKSVIVRINDRGPFIKGRIIDLSAHAAEVIGLKLGKVKLSIV